MGELKEALAVFDILAHHTRRRRVELGDGAKTEKSDFTACKLLSDLGPLFTGEPRLDPMPVGRPQFNGFKAGLLAVPDDGGNIPVLSQVVGDQTQPGGWPRRGLGQRLTRRQAGG